MENQNMQWQTWKEQSQENNEQPQVNWDEQSQEQSRDINNNWGDQPQQVEQQQENISTWGESEGQPQIDWGEPQQTIQHKNPHQPTWEDPQQSPLVNPLNNQNNFSIINIEPQNINLSFNKEEILDNLRDADLNLIDIDGKYDFSPKENTSLGTLIKNIVTTGIENNTKVTSCHVYKIPPNHTVLNPNSSKPKASFFICLNPTQNSNEVLADLTSIGGPLVSIPTPLTPTLTIIPGWIPTRISKNESDEEIVYIVGSFD